MLRSLFLPLMVVVAAPLSAETRLMMFDQPNCSWCAA